VKRSANPIFRCKKEIFELFLPLLVLSPAFFVIIWKSCSQVSGVVGENTNAGANKTSLEFGIFLFEIYLPAPVPAFRLPVGLLADASC
jgi:hypothetical protein